MKRVDINAILRDDPVNCRYGAPLGQANRLGENLEPLYLQRVRFTDGDYAPDGTYWGAPADLWCAFSADGATRLYVRAEDRQAAAASVHDEYDVRLRREPAA